MRRSVVLIAILLLLGSFGPVWGQTATPQAPVSTEQTTSDRQLTAQLREAFRQVRGLDRVTLEVRGGVAVLRGTVPSLETRIEAEELARKLDGVLTVDNGLEVDSRVGERLSPALSNLYEKAQAFVAFAPLFGVAVILFFFFLFLGSLVTRWDAPYSRLSHNLFVQDLLKQIVYLLFALLGALLALELLDATALVGAVLGTAGVLGVAIGFAFRDLAENSLASILLSIRQPFSPNDHVVIDGQEGKVVRLTSRATILLTLDGNHLRIPNATVFKASILNFTRNPERRFSFLVGVGTNENLLAVQTLALETLREAPGVVKEPGPGCQIESLGDWTVNLKVLGWVDQRNNEFLKVRSEAIRRVKDAFDEAKISMPEPIQTVRLEQVSDKTSPTERPEKPLSAVEPDLQPETHLDKRIIEERTEESNDDLLQVTGKQE